MNNEVSIHLDRLQLHGNLHIPSAATGLVLFVHGSGSSRLSPRNRYVAEVLQSRRLATLLFDLLTQEEGAEDAFTGHLRFDIELLSRRLLAVTDLLTSGVYPQYGNASIGVFTGGGVGLAGAIACTYSSDCPLSQFSGNLSLTATAGDEYRIHMTATAEGVDVSASADPHIFVDPAWPDASRYTILVSDGVGNGPAPVPAPGALPLLGSALGLFGLIRRGGKRDVARKARAAAREAMKRVGNLPAAMR